MKIGVVGDVHWSKYSSILRTRGEKYSTRLENCIQTFNWIEQEMKDKYDYLIYVGDVFDKPELNAEEISALGEIDWGTKPHIFLTGNHEMGINNLSFSSSKVFKLDATNDVIDRPCKDDFVDFEICYLPYIREEDRKSIEEYFGIPTKPRLIVSHNDISGFQMGAFISKAGFEIEDIQLNCTLYLNGHLHNGGKVADKIYNVGNITGQNFSEDATKYTHQMFIVDTDTMTIETYENPYALNFYKLDSSHNIEKFNFKSNSVVTLSALESKVEEVKNYLDNNKKILTYRVLSIPEAKDFVDLSDNITLSVDHLEKFKEFTISQLGTSDIVIDELKEVCHG